MINLPLESMLRTVRIAASNAGSGFARRSLSPLTIMPGNKRLRMTNERKEQAELFALEEAELHEQVMIEQDIFQRRLEEQRETRQEEAEQREAEPEPQSEQRVTEPEQLPEAPLAPTPLAVSDQPPRIILAPAAQKRETIERKLALIRQRLDAPEKQNKNAAGIATLRAAMAC